MRILFCTLAICLTILAATLSTQALIRAEARRPRAGTPPAADAAEPDAALSRKLDALGQQLDALGRRLSALEGAVARTAAAPRADAHEEVRSLSSALARLSAAVARLDGVPRHLAELTTYLDRSFSHLEQVAAARRQEEDLAASLDWLVGKVDRIDRSFTPLLTFFGVDDDPANDDVLAAYPSVDERLTALSTAVEALREAVADIRGNMLVPTVIEPAKRPR